MTNRIIWTLFTIVFISCVKVNVESEERQIRELWTKASQSLCDGDWVSYAECWAHSSKIQLIHPDQEEWLKGWEEIGPKYQEVINSGISCNIPRNDLKLNISTSGDMAWGTVDVEIHFNDTAKTQVRLWETIIFEKINGKWKIVHGMASIPKNI